MWRMGRVTAGGTLAVLLALAAVVGCERPAGEKSKPATAQLLNVVLVMVDTLRADHLSGYGYHRKTSPNLDEFAAGAILFEDNRSQSTCTFPSVNSLLTSRYPIQFLGQQGATLAIPPTIVSLPEILKEEGYSTVALSASPIVRKSPSRFNPHGGFDRGYDFFGEGCAWKSADCIHDRLKHQLRNLEQPFFTYLHFMDPHGPYQPPAGHRRRFAKDFKGPDFVLAGDPNPIAEAIYGTGPVLRWRDSDMDHLLDLYDEEIAYFDALFPRLAAALEEVGALANTVIVVVSDHGEEFFEHGHVRHCRAPFDTLVRTPFILRLPGGPAGLRVRGAVQNLDLVPTLLDYLGIDYAHYGFDGVSLRQRIEEAAHGRSAPSATDEPPLAFSSQDEWRSVFDGRFKLLFHQRRGVFQLFDVVADPGEKEELSRQRPEELSRLRRTLVQWLIKTEGGVANPEALARGDESERQLRALGYIQ